MFDTISSASGNIDWSWERCLIRVAKNTLEHNGHCGMATCVALLSLLGRISTIDRHWPFCINLLVQTYTMAGIKRRRASSSAQEDYVAGTRTTRSSSRNTSVITKSDTTEVKNSRAEFRDKRKRRRVIVLDDSDEETDDVKVPTPVSSERDLSSSPEESQEGNKSQGDRDTNDTSVEAGDSEDTEDIKDIPPEGARERSIEILSDEDSTDDDEPTETEPSSNNNNAEAKDWNAIYSAPDEGLDALRRIVWEASFREEHTFQFHDDHNAKLKCMLQIHATAVHSTLGYRLLVKLTHKARGTIRENDEIAHIDAFRISKPTAAKPDVPTAWIKDYLTLDLRQVVHGEHTKDQEMGVCFQGVFTPAGNPKDCVKRKGLGPVLKKDGLMYIKEFYIRRGYQGQGLSKLILSTFHGMLGRLPEWYAFSGSVLLTPGRLLDSRGAAWEGVEDDSEVIESLIRVYEKSGYGVWVRDGKVGPGYVTTVMGKVLPDQECRRVREGGDDEPRGSNTRGKRKGSPKSDPEDMKDEEPQPEATESGDDSDYEDTEEEDLEYEEDDDFEYEE
jgi:hypothetical protein